MRAHISRSRQVAQIYGGKSYRDLKWGGKLFLALNYLVVLLFLGLVLEAISLTIYFMIETAIKYGVGEGLRFGVSPLFWGLDQTFVVVALIIFGTWSVLILLFTRMFGATFYSAFLSPFRWCAYRVGAIKGIFKQIATFVVRDRGWSVVLAIAMGLEGYREPLPRIEQKPTSVPEVKYENMPAGAQERALAKRGAWIYRHLDNIAHTFSKLVVTSADITTLQHAIESDQTLVHAAYYTDDECIARIAEWIAAEDHVPSNAIIGG
jgi:hypothetical protein